MFTKHTKSTEVNVVLLMSQLGCCPVFLQSRVSVFSALDFLFSRGTATRYIQQSPTRALQGTLDVYYLQSDTGDILQTYSVTSTGESTRQTVPQLNSSLVRRMLAYLDCQSIAWRCMVFLIAALLHKLLPKLLNTWNAKGSVKRREWSTQLTCLITNVSITDYQSFVS